MKMFRIEPKEEIEEKIQMMEDSKMIEQIVSSGISSRDMYKSAGVPRSIYASAENAIAAVERERSARRTAHNIKVAKKRVVPGSIIGPYEVVSVHKHICVLNGFTKNGEPESFMRSFTWVEIINLIKKYGGNTL